MTTIRAIVSAFGALGWVELSAALVVAIGCVGEFFIIVNKLTAEVEPISRNASFPWRCLAWIDSRIRPLLVRLKLSKRRLSETREHLLERFFVLLVAFGVTMEFLALPFSMLEIARLNKEASESVRLAAEANEKASIAYFDGVKLSKHIEELRSTNLLLEAKLKPRTISQTQITNFMFLTERIVKIPIRIHAGFAGDDTFPFAIQLRGMFSMAGFPEDGSPNGVAIDIGSPVTTFVYRLQGDTSEWPSLIYVTHETNSMKEMAIGQFEITNGFFRPIVTGNDTNAVYEAIFKCLNQIGMKTIWSSTTYWMSPGGMEFYIPPKNY